MRGKTEYKPFSSFMRLLRKKYDKTQDEMVDYIQSVSSKFYGLDAVTLSRWEHGITLPSFHKRIELMEVFDCCINEVLDIALLGKESNSDNLNRFDKDLYTTSGKQKDVEVKTMSFSDFAAMPNNDFWFVAQEFLSEEQLFPTSWTTEQKIERLSKLPITVSLYYVLGRLTEHVITASVCDETHWQLLNEEDPVIAILFQNNSEQGLHNCVVLSIHLGSDLIFHNGIGALLSSFLVGPAPKNNLSFLTLIKGALLTLPKLGFKQHERTHYQTANRYEMLRSKKLLELILNYREITQNACFNKEVTS